MFRHFLRRWGVASALVAWNAVPNVAGTLYVSLKGLNLFPETLSQMGTAPSWALFAHVIGAFVFTNFGAVLVTASARQDAPGGHAKMGWLIVTSGLMIALSGLWLLMEANPEQEMLNTARLVFGLVLYVSLIQALVSALNRDIPAHRSWMIRAYAIASGAGTEVILSILWEMFPGKQADDMAEVLSTLSWFVNLAFAELIIRWKRNRPYHAYSHG